MTTPRAETFQIALTANKREALALSGDFLRVLEATGEFNFWVNGEYRVRADKGMGYKLPPGQRFTSLHVEDLTGAANTIRFVYGDGDFHDNRVPFPIPSPSRIVPGVTEYAVPAAASTSLFSSASAIIETILKASQANTVPIYVGAHPCTNAGSAIPLYPGETLILKTSSQIGVYATIAAQKLSFIQLWR